MKNWKKVVACTAMSVAAVCLSIFGIVMKPVAINEASAAETAYVYSNETKYWQVDAWNVTGVNHQATNEGVVMVDPNTTGYNGTMYVNAPVASTVDGGYKSTVTSTELNGNATINWWLFGNVTSTDYWGYNWIIFQDTSKKFTTTENIEKDIKLDEKDENTVPAVTMYTESTEWTPRKVRDTDNDGVVDMPANSVGNWLALVTGVSEGAVSLYQCENGEVTLVQTLTRDAGAYTSHTPRTTVDGVASSTAGISITTEDTDVGVNVSISYTEGSTEAVNDKVYTFEYSSDNNALWGEQNFTIGYWGSENCSYTGGTTDSTFRYTVSVTPRSSNHVYENYSTSLSTDKWADFSKIAVNSTATALTMENRTTNTTDVYSTYAATQQVGGDSIFDFTISANLSPGADWGTTGLWAYDWILFKNTARNAGLSWTPQLDSNDNPKSSEGDWLALAFGASIGAKMFECKDGVVTMSSIANPMWQTNGLTTDLSKGGTIPGSDASYTYAQTTHIKLVTLDTATGVEVKLSFYAEGHSGNTKHVYEYNYTSENGNLWGPQSFVIGHIGNGQYDDTTNYNYNLRIMDVESTYLNNVAGNVSNWTEKDVTNTSVAYNGYYGMSFTPTASGSSGSASVLLNRNVETNSTVYMEFLGDVATTSHGTSTNRTEQVGVAIMLKDVSEQRNASALLNVVQSIGCMNDSATQGQVVGYMYQGGTAGATETGGTVDTTQNWVGLYFGNNSFALEIYECVAGVITRSSTWGAQTAFNYFGYNQTSKFTIKTTDNANGTVTLSIVYANTQANHANGTVWSDETKTYTTTGTCFAGDYGLSVAVLNNIGTDVAGTGVGGIQLVDMAVYEESVTDTSEVGVRASGIYLQDARFASLSMAGDVAVNFYMALAPCVLNDTTAEIYCYVDNGLYQSVTVSAMKTKEKINGTDCYQFTCGFPPRKYQSYVRIVLYTDGTYYEVYQGAVIENYIKTVTEDTEDTYTTEAKAAVTALEAYCVGAKAYFAEEEVSSVEVDTSDVLADTNKITTEIVNAESVSENLTVKDFGYSSVSLVLEKEITFRLGICADDVSVYTVYVNDVAQSWVQRDKGNGEWYYVDVTGIKIGDLDKKFTIKIVRTDGSSCTFTCNAFSYMRAVLKTEEKEGADTNLINLLKQMYIYYQKANDYNTTINA